MSKTLRTVQVFISNFSICDEQYGDLHEDEQLCSGRAVCACHIAATRICCLRPAVLSA